MLTPSICDSITRHHRPRLARVVMFYNTFHSVSACGELEQKDGAEIYVSVHLLVEVARMTTTPIGRERGTDSGQLSERVKLAASCIRNANCGLLIQLLCFGQPPAVTPDQAPLTV
eukprot:410021-Pleurochrysis_carterae.AAC.1